MYQPLISLLSDPDPDVRRAALAAAGRVKHPRLLPLVARNLAGLATRSAASDALVSYSDQILPLVEQALSGDELSEEESVRLVRVCGQIKGEQVQILMRRNLDHSSNRVRDQILAVLSASRFSAQAADLPALNRALVRDVSRGQYIMVARQDVGESKAMEPLQQALIDEMAQVNKRIFLLLSFMYEAQPVLRAQSQLERGSGSERALALEMLDVTLSADHQALVFPLIDPKLNLAQRIQMLNKRIEMRSLGRDQRLQDLIEHSDHGWTRACALYAAAQLGAVAQLDANKLVPVVERSLVDTDPVVRETALWGLHKLDPKRFKQHVSSMRDDEDRYVAQMLSDLSEA
jgi:AAA family ATP:ADP antiporter